MDGLCNFVSMNISGRFTGKEIKRYGQEVLKFILVDRSIGVFFGQQTNFKPELPAEYDFMGPNKAFLIYDTREIIAGDEKHYKWYLRDLELQDRLPKNYLPETNYIICKMKISSVQFDFIAMSWVTDECMGKHRATSMFKKLCTFIENLAEVEDMPIIIGGSFRITADDAKSLVPPDFRVCSYIPTNRRRVLRQSNFYICSRSMTFSDLKPVVCGKMEIHNGSNGRNGNVKLINPEDVFYFDPVVATLQSRHHISIHETVRKLDQIIKESKDYVPLKKAEPPEYLPLIKQHQQQKASSIPMLKKDSQDYVPKIKRQPIVDKDGYLKKIPMVNNDFLYLYEVDNDNNDQMDSGPRSVSENNIAAKMEELDSETQTDNKESKNNNLQKAASFVELYDEEVMQNTGLKDSSPTQVLYSMERVNHLLVSLSSELTYRFQQISKDNTLSIDPNEESTLSAKHADVMQLIIKSTSVENIGPGYY